MTAFSRRPWLPAVTSAVAVLAIGILLPDRSHAIPAFARKYNVKCYTCHLIPPVLNKTGYMFKRLGYRMPPDNMEAGQKVLRISELDKDIKWSVTNSLALVTQASFTLQKTKSPADTSSKSSFNFDKALLFLAGSLPESNFSYFAEFKFHEHGESGMEQAVIGYTGGRANSSFFAKAGEMHIQEGEGTRAAMFFSLFADPAPLLTATSPINFSLDRHPAGVNAGYTYAMPLFKQIFGIQAKVTNGLNPDGSEILFDSHKNSKDFWANADWWFGPDGGVTFLTYYGRKGQVQNAGTPDEFTFNPSIRRYGVLGNYLFFDHLDVQGGYIRSHDDWKNMASDATGSFISNGYRAEIDYYIQRGFALMGRWDRLNQKLLGSSAGHEQDWSVGAERALTAIGNVVLRGAYTQAHITDPISRDVTSDKVFEADIRLMW